MPWIYWQPTATWKKCLCCWRRIQGHLQSHFTIWNCESQHMLHWLGRCLAITSTSTRSFLICSKHWTHHMWPSSKITSQNSFADRLLQKSLKKAGKVSPRASIRMFCHWASQCLWQHTPVHEFMTSSNMLFTDGRYSGPLSHKNGVMVGSGQEGHLDSLEMAAADEGVVQGIINVGGERNHCLSFSTNNQEAGHSHYLIIKLA